MADFPLLPPKASSGANDGVRVCVRTAADHQFHLRRGLCNGAAQMGAASFGPSFGSTVGGATVAHFPYCV